jgi:hypothetical protein
VEVRYVNIKEKDPIVNYVMEVRSADIIKERYTVNNVAEVNYVNLNGVKPMEIINMMVIVYSVSSIFSLINLLQEIIKPRNEL